MKKKRIFNYAPTGRDMSDLERLGLSTASTKHGVAESIGVVTARNDGQLPDGATIRVAVTRWPAQAWAFDIITGEGERLKMSCGTGPFEKYYEVAVMAAQGMFTMQKIEKEHETEN